MLHTGPFVCLKVNASLCEVVDFFLGWLSDVRTHIHLVFCVFSWEEKNLVWEEECSGAPESLPFGNDLIA